MGRFGKHAGPSCFAWRMIRCLANECGDEWRPSRHLFVAGTTALQDESTPHHGVPENSQGNFQCGPNQWF